MITAYKIGQMEALTTTIGKPFRGTMPEADKHYPVGSVEYQEFIDGFLSVLKDYDVLVNPDNGLISGFYLKVTK